MTENEDVTVSPDGTVRVRGLPICQKVKTEQGIRLRFQRKKNSNATKKKGRYISIPVESLISAIEGE